MATQIIAGAIWDLRQEEVRSGFYPKDTKEERKKGVKSSFSQGWIWCGSPLFHPKCEADDTIRQALGGTG